MVLLVYTVKIPTPQTNNEKREQTINYDAKYTENAAM